MGNEMDLFICFSENIPIGGLVKKKINCLTNINRRKTDGGK